MTTTLNFTPIPSITVRSPVGASLSFSVTARNPDGSPLDLSGYALTAPLLERDNFVPPVAAFGLALTDVGTITLSLDATQTELLGAPFAPITWPFCVWMESADERRQLVRGGLVLAAP